MPTKTDLDIIPYTSDPDMCPISSRLNGQLSTFQHFAKQVTGADSSRQLPHTLSYFLDSLWSVTRRSHPSVYIVQGARAHPVTARSQDDFRRDFCCFFFV